MAQSLNMPAWMQRLVLELRRDKKRTSLLAVLVLVAAIVVGRQVVHSAAPVSAATAVVSTDAPVAQMAPAVAPSMAAGDVQKLVPLQSREHKFVRDLFRPDPQAFPPLTEDVGPQQVMSVEGEQESARRKIETQAASLVLQSTILGSRPKAILNGNVISLGGSIEGFSLISIEARFCVLEKDGVSVRLDMK